MILAPCFYPISLCFVLPPLEPHIPTGRQACWDDEDIFLIDGFATEMKVKINQNGSKSTRTKCYIDPGALLSRCIN